MNLKNSELITLNEGEEYIVISSIVNNNQNYVVLLTVKKPATILIAKEELINDEPEIVPVTDVEEAKQIINIFSKMKQEII